MRDLYERVFPRWRPDRTLRPRGSGAGAAARITWLGTAGFVVRTAGGTTLLVDPFVTRQGLGHLVSSRIVPDDAEIARTIPASVDAVLCGHSHYDHVADAPRIARLRGAKLVGSLSTCSWGRAEGLAENSLVRVPPSGAILHVGDAEIRFVPSRHGKVAFGPLRIPQLPGEVAEPPALPARASAYRMGGAFGVLIRTPDLTIYHNGSADLIDAELDGERADVLLACLAGRRGTQNYVARLLSALQPRLVVPAHQDAFFAPLSRGVHLLPKIDVEGFISEVKVHASGAAVITPDYREAIAIPTDARGAVITE